MNTKTDSTEGSSDQSIGRPQAWKEGRYQQPGKSVDEDVTKESGEAPTATPPSTPVTRKDYEQIPAPEARAPGGHSPGGGDKRP